MGTDNFDEELDLALLENEQQLLVDIDDALARIKAGTYGRCENCHREIPRERLEALPYARYCMECAEKLERVVRVERIEIMPSLREIESARRQRPGRGPRDEVASRAALRRRQDRPEADFLVVVHKRVGHRSHQFEQFFYDTIKKHILEDGRIDAEEVEWLRQMIDHDGARG